MGRLGRRETFTLHLAPSLCFWGTPSTHCPPFYMTSHHRNLVLIWETPNASRVWLTQVSRVEGGGICQTEKFPRRKDHVARLEVGPAMWNREPRCCLIRTHAHGHTVSRWSQQLDGWLFCSTIKACFPLSSLNRVGQPWALPASYRPGIGEINFSDSRSRERGLAAWFWVSTLFSRGREECREQGHHSLHLAFRTGSGCSDWHHCSHFGIMKWKPRQPVSPPYSVVKHISGRLRVSERMKNLNKTPRSFSNHLSVWI